MRTFAGAQYCNADDDHEKLFAEMDLIADGLVGGPTFHDACQVEFGQLQKLYYPELSTQQWLSLFDRWRVHYEYRLRDRVAAAEAAIAELNGERDKLLRLRTRWMLAPIRETAEQRLWAIGNEIADIEERALPRRPAPVAAKWSVDSDASWLRWPTDPQGYSGRA